MKKYLITVLMIITTSAVFYAVYDYLNYAAVEFNTRRAIGALTVGIVITLVLVKMVFKPKAES